MSITTIASRNGLVLARRSAELSVVLDLNDLTQNQIDSVFSSSDHGFDKAHREPNGGFEASFFVDGDPEATWTVSLEFQVADRTVAELHSGQSASIVAIVNVLIEKQCRHRTDEDHLDNTLDFDIVVPSTLAELINKIRSLKIIDKIVDSIDVSNSRLFN